MSRILIDNNKNIIVCINNMLLIVDDTKKKVKKIVLPMEANVIKNTEGNGDSDNDEETPKTTTTREKSVNEYEEPEIQQIALSLCGVYLAITTSLTKVLYIYELKENNYEILCKKHISRTSSALKFLPNKSKSIILTDKSGDCYLYDFCTGSLNSEWILGHLSIVLDVLLTLDTQYILTCDRDEKIRITNFTKPYIIETYCLGHSEYISSINFLPHDNNILLSLSGDKTLNLWSYMSGTRIFERKLNDSGLLMRTKLINSSTSHIAINFYKNNKIQFFSITNTGDDLQMNIINEIEFINENHTINDFLFAESYFIVYLVNLKTNKIFLRKYELIDNMYKELNDLEELNGLLNDHHANIKIHLNDSYEILFKKKFDNLKDYHEKKRKRIGPNIDK